MGYGQLNKVILQFEAPFWEDDCDFFGAILQQVGQQLAVMMACWEALLLPLCCLVLPTGSCLRVACDPTPCRL
jgi:hypothetical protein